MTEMHMHVHGQLVCASGCGFLFAAQAAMSCVCVLLAMQELAMRKYGRVGWSDLPAVHTQAHIARVLLLPCLVLSPSRHHHHTTLTHTHTHIPIPTTTPNRYVEPLVENVTLLRNHRKFAEGDPTNVSKHIRQQLSQQAAGNAGAYCVAIDAARPGTGYIAYGAGGPESSIYKEWFNITPNGEVGATRVCVCAH